MNDLLDDDDPGQSRNERELTLSTGAILGIFLTLVLLCGACFGVGYNMGRKSAPAPLALDNGNEPLSDPSLAPKPAASAAAETSAVTQPAPAPKPSPIVRKPPPPAPATTVATDDNRETPTPAPPAHPTAALPPTAAPGSGSIMVQVAAVSHQEDADLLLGALRARGYTVTARPSGADNFIHVQVGPFKEKNDAEAMRQRLLSDGYNAMLKF